MGKIKDMFATQIKEYGRHEKRKRWEQTIPRFINYDITIKQINEKGIKEFDLVVTDLLDIKDKRKIITKVGKIDNRGLILSIKCPFCGNSLTLNKHWNAYLCCNGEHERKVFEVKDIEYKRPEQIVELEEDEW